MNSQRHIDAPTRAYLARAAASASKPRVEMTVDEARASMRAGQQACYGHPLLRVESMAIAGVPVRVVGPRAATKPVPTVLYLHGGGWMLGSPETHAGIVQELALRTRAAFVVPDYALAPEHPFPAAFEQCYSIAEALCAGGGPTDLDARRIALAGDSAGGNLAAAIALHAAARGEMRFGLQALICPALDPEMGANSYAEFAEGFDLTAAAMRWFWMHYAGGSIGLRDSRLAPLHTQEEAFAQAPPACIVTAGCDVLRDEAEQYAERLWKAGNSAVVLRFPGTIHNFPVMDELRATPAAEAAVAAIADALTRAFASASPEVISTSPQRTEPA